MIALSHRTIDCLLPVPPVRTWDWIRKKCYNHKGRPFNAQDYPWMEGIADAWDDPKVERVFMMAGSRMGKTEQGLSMIQCAEANDPDLGLIVGSTEKLIIRTIGQRLWAMLEKSHATRPLCPPVHRRAQKQINCRTFKIFGGWSGSPTTLGDLDPRYVVMLEVDKFTQNATRESDPFFMAVERGSEIPDRRLYGESTPTIDGVSRIADLVFAGTNNRFHVPCPYCDFHQELVINETFDPTKGGLWWDKVEGVTTSAGVAGKTAVYICARCNEAIPEEKRRPMIRRGVWCPQGMNVDDFGFLEGEKTNDVPDETFQISRLYGSTFTFGKVARSYVNSRGDTKHEQNFENDWMGLPYVKLVVQMKWEALAEKLCVGEWSSGTVPMGCVFVTTAVDVQLDHFVITTFGWDRDKRAHLVKHGIVLTWEEVEDWVTSEWPHEDGHAIFSRMNLVDSRDGNRKDEIVDACRRMNKETSPFVWPSMGNKYGQIGVVMFRTSVIDAPPETSAKAKKNKLSGLNMVTVNTTVTQDWIDNAMVRRNPGDPMSIILPRDIVNEGSLFRQLLNERYDKDEGKHVRVDENTIPVDYRDCFRYGRCSAEVYTDGNWAAQPYRRVHRQQTRDDLKAQQAAAARQEQVEQLKKETEKFRDRDNPDDQPRRAGWSRFSNSRKNFIRGRQR